MSPAEALGLPALGECEAPLSFSRRTLHTGPAPSALVARNEGLALAHRPPPRPPSGVGTPRGTGGQRGSGPTFPWPVAAFCKAPPQPPPRRHRTWPFAISCQRIQKIKFISPTAARAPLCAARSLNRWHPGRGWEGPRAPRFSPQPPPASEPQDIGFPSVWSVKGDKSIGILSSEGVFPFIPLGNEPMNGKSIAYLAQRGPRSPRQVQFHPDFSAPPPPLHHQSLPKAPG